MTQRRTPREIAQSHADKAAEAVERHDAKVEKAKEKKDRAQAEYDNLVARREELVEEADYRQAHPLLKKAEQSPLQGDGDDNPFA